MVYKVGDEIRVQEAGDYLTARWAFARPTSFLRSVLFVDGSRLTLRRKVSQWRKFPTEIISSKVIDAWREEGYVSVSPGTPIGASTEGTAESSDEEA